MRSLVDSSVMVAYLVKDHPKYENAVQAFLTLIEQNSEFYICAHSISEIYRTLTWGRGYLKFTAGFNPYCRGLLLRGS